MQPTTPTDLIDWDGKLVEVKLALELPFWVLVEDHRFEVEINGLTLRLETVADGIDVQSGTLHSRTHARSRFFGRVPEPQDRGIHSPIDLIQGANFRWTRTQCWISTSALSDALAALDSEPPRSRIAREYFVSLAMGHIPFVNKLLNAYRRVTGDPFAQEITEYDVPLWFLVSDECLCPLHLVPALGEDRFPSIRRENSDAPYHAGSPDEIKSALSRQPVPGEAELRDAWSLCYRGRFGDSIRSAVTAIEVLLEARLESVLQSNGLSAEEAAERLAATKNRFASRLDDYCRHSGRAVPGPTLHYIPYLNGLRLRKEFEMTRDLRHDIVHRGKRLDLSLRRPMRRALETTTWLFDWLSDEEPIGDRQIANYTYCEGLRGVQRMECEIDDRGVHVRPLVVQSPVDFDDNATCLAEMSEARIVNSIEVDDLPDAVFHATLNRFPDLEHFVLMAMAKLGFNEVEDVFQDPEASSIAPRWRAKHDSMPIAVFLFETGSGFSESDFQQLGQDILSESQQHLPVLVVHDRSGVAWTSRSTEAIDPIIASEAVSRGIRIARSHDLARFASACKTNGWSMEEIAAELFAVGWSRLPPPNTRIVGTVRRYFPRQKVMSINLDGSSAVSVGDTLWVRVRDALLPFPVHSMQQNKQVVSTAQTGCIGVEAEFVANLVVLEGEVFLDLRQQTQSDPTLEASALQELLGGFKGGY